MEDQPLRFNVRQALLLIIVLILWGVLVYVGFSSITSQLKLENAVVLYYGRTVTQGELVQEVGDLNCAAIPFGFPAANLWHQLIRQPTFNCFNTMDEAHEWGMSVSQSYGG